MLQLAREHGEDRFFNAVKARRNHYHHNHYQQSSSQRSRSTAAAGVSPSPSPAAYRNKVPSVVSGLREPDNRARNSDEQSKTGAATATALSTASTAAAVSSACNLDRFLESTTPLVPAQCLSKTRIRGSRTCDVEFQPYFALTDLWESFKEWSAYGAGVPIVLNHSDSVIQYYVPYLSGMQLYVESSRSSGNSRPSGDESDGDSCRDSSSDGSSDYEHEKTLKYSRSWNSNHSCSLSNLRMDRMSLREKHVNQEEGSSSDDGGMGNYRGHLLFEFLEHDPPFIREPLADKISDLAQRYPSLKTLRSCDLSPYSWMSVAWYPIYRIPTGPTLKDLDACFLTFHYLSTALKDVGSASGPVITYPQGADGVLKVALRSFGLASYKFRSSIWTPNEGPELQHATSMLQAADDLLHLVNVNHPDYRFFVSHGAYRR